MRGILENDISKGTGNFYKYATGLIADATGLRKEDLGTVDGVMSFRVGMIDGLRAQVDIVHENDNPDYRAIRVLPIDCPENIGRLNMSYENTRDRTIVLCNARVFNTRPYPLDAVYFVETIKEVVDSLTPGNWQATVGTLCPSGEL